MWEIMGETVYIDWGLLVTFWACETQRTDGHLTKNLVQGNFLLQGKLDSTGKFNFTHFIPLQLHILCNCCLRSHPDMIDTPPWPPTSAQGTPIEYPPTISLAASGSCVHHVCLQVDQTQNVNVSVPRVCNLTRHIVLNECGSHPRPILDEQSGGDHW